jgi:hypothetical protein
LVEEEYRVCPSPAVAAHPLIAKAIAASSTG